MPEHTTQGTVIAPLHGCERRAEEAAHETTGPRRPVERATHWGGPAVGRARAGPRPPTHAAGDRDGRPPPGRLLPDRRDDGAVRAIRAGWARSRGPRGAGTAPVARGDPRDLPDARCRLCRGGCARASGALGAGPGRPPRRIPREAPRPKTTTGATPRRPDDTLTARGRPPSTPASSPASTRRSPAHSASGSVEGQSPDDVDRLHAPDHPHDKKRKLVGELGRGAEAYPPRAVERPGSELAR